MTNGYKQMKLFMIAKLETSGNQLQIIQILSILKVYFYILGKPTQRVSNTVSADNVKQNFVVSILFTQWTYI